MTNFSLKVLPNKKKREFGILKSMKHLNGKYKNIKLNFRKCPNCKEGGGGVETFSNFLKI